MSSQQRKVLFIDSTHPLLPEQLTKDGYQCDYFQSLKREDLKKILPNYVGVIVRSKIRLDAEMLDLTDKLKFIGRVGAGLENIDFDYAALKGIACLNAPEGNRDAVAEHAIGMLLSLFNNLVRSDREVREGIWQRELNRGTELGGKTVGIIGYGNTGGAFAKKLNGFDVSILAYDKYKFDFSDEFVLESTMNELFKKCDIVSFHVPLTEETKYLCNDYFIKKFRKNIYIINTSRGKVLDTSDLVKHLETGKVLGACLDVLEYENLSFENLKQTDKPETFRKLCQFQNVILSPHIAGWTHESEYKLALTIVEKIRALKSL